MDSNYGDNTAMVVKTAMLLQENPTEIVNDECFGFKGFGNFKSECKVKIWDAKGYALVMLTDKGIGTSITNASESVVQAVYERYLFGKYSPDHIFFMETYDDYRVEGVDLVIPKWENGRVIEITWLPTKIQRITNSKKQI